MRLLSRTVKIRDTLLEKRSILITSTGGYCDSDLNHARRTQQKV